MSVADRSAPAAAPGEQRRSTGGSRAALVVLLVMTAVAGAFVFSFSAALGDPRPHDIPVAVVDLDPKEVARAFAQVDRSSVRAVRVRDVAAAERAIADQQVYAALVGPPSTPRLLVSTASGAAVAQTLTHEAQQVGARLGLALKIRDLHPGSSRDPSGTVFFYIALAALLMGFIGVVQTAVNAPHLPFRAQLGWSAGRAVAMGAVIVLVAGPLLMMQPLPLLPATLLLAAAAWTSEAAYECFRLLVGARWAMLPTWIVFVLIGVPSSGGTVASPLLPPVLAALGQVLPSGAVVAALRDMTWFGSAPHAQPYVVLGAWGAAATAGWILLAHRKKAQR